MKSQASRSRMLWLFVIIILFCTVGASEANWGGTICGGAILLLLLSSFFKSRKNTTKSKSSQPISDIEASHNLPIYKRTPLPPPTEVAKVKLAPPSNKAEITVRRPRIDKPATSTEETIKSVRLRNSEASSNPFRSVNTTQQTRPNSSSFQKYPIPERPKKQPVFRQPTNNYRVETSIASSGELFVNLAKQIVSRVANKTAPVPFTEYYPTYARMGNAQQKWYFYWRSQVRQGQYLPTDLSYIFVHVYEAISVVGFESAELAKQRLVDLWINYRTQHPKLDNYLVDWIADFIVFHRLYTPTLDWYGTAIQAGARIQDEDLAFEAQLRKASSLADFPLPLIYQLANYSPLQNKFYTEYNTDGKVERGYRLGLNAVEQFVRKHEQKALFELFRASTQREIARQPFQGAVHAYPTTPIRIATVSNRFGSTDFANHLTGIIKYSENILRKQADFKSKLRGIEIPDTWKAAIDQAFAAATPRRSITIDHSKLKELIDESEAVRSRLTFEEEKEPPPILPTPRKKIVIDQNKLKDLIDESEAIRSRLTFEEQATSPSSASPVVQNPLPSPTSESKTSTFNTDRPSNTPSGLLTDLVPIAKIMGSATTPTTKILRILHDHAWEATLTDLTKSLAGMFVNVEIDKMNELALELVGDYLLFEENGKWCVAEDYRDEITHLLNQSNLHDVASAQPEITTPTLDYSELSNEWAQFSKAMHSEHWETLLVMVTEDNYSARLPVIARSVHSTVSRMIDEINEAAYDTIGDIIIDASSDTPVIESEDIDSVKSLLAWARTKSLVGV